MELAGLGTMACLYEVSTWQTKLHGIVCLIGRMSPIEERRGSAVD